MERVLWRVPKAVQQEAERNRECAISNTVRCSLFEFFSRKNKLDLFIMYIHRTVYITILYKNITDVSMRQQ